MTEMTDPVFRSTGKTTMAWMTRIEQLIAEAQTPITDETTRAQLSASGIDPDKHTGNDPRTWLKHLVFEVFESRPMDRAYDTNMMMASSLGLILSAWYTRMQHVKAMDARRPVHDRRLAFAYYAEFCAAMAGVAVDATIDALVWPDCEWSHPFAPKPKGGDYR